VQVRQAVELLVQRSAARHRIPGARRAGLSYEDAHDVYRGAVSVMMRIIFVLFAEERGLLPPTTSCTSSRTPSADCVRCWNSRRGRQ